jgi:hypothetical protein
MTAVSSGIPTPHATHTVASSIRVERFPRGQILSVSSLMSRAMKFRTQGDKQRSEFSALMPVLALLMAATLAKSGAVAQLVHIARVSFPFL